MTFGRTTTGGSQIGEGVRVNEAKAKTEPKGFDGLTWATAFMERFGDCKEKIDESLMLGWFANAIMSGYDCGVRAGRLDERRQVADNRGIAYWQRVAEAKQTERDEALAEVARLKNELALAKASESMLESVVSNPIPGRSLPKDWSEADYADLLNTIEAFKARLAKRHQGKDSESDGEPQ